MVAITAFLAVRLLQLRESQGLPAVQEITKCDELLREDEWKILWVSTERDSPPPSPPSARWAYLALAKLGGFADTKRTGRPGCACYGASSSLQGALPCKAMPLRKRGAVLHEFPAPPCHSKPLLDTPPCQPKKSIDFICHVMGEDWYHC